jgi:hypothetical protein
MARKGLRSNSPGDWQEGRPTPPRRHPAANVFGRHLSRSVSRETVEL